MNPICVNSCSSVVLFHFPESCRVDQRIGKALFADNGPLTPADRRTFRNEIEEIVCSYVLDENHGIMLTPYSDEEHDDTCLAQVDVFLKKPGKAVRVAELCHRAIPYPLIVILHETTEYTENTENTELPRNETIIKRNLPCSSVSFRGSKIMFSMAEKRFSRDGKEQVVLEREVHTSWHDSSALEEFCSAADFAMCRACTFQELVRCYIERLEELNVMDITGVWPSAQMRAEERRSLLAEIHAIDSQLDALKAQARRESELSRQVELNTKARELVLHRQALIGKLES